MGKYDEDYYKFDADLLKDPGNRVIAYFMYKVANELAESNRLTRQKLATAPEDWYSVDELPDKA